MQGYAIRFKERARKSLETLDEKLQERIVHALEQLASNPIPRNALKLTGNGNLWRIRVGMYRVVYEIQNEVLVVYVVKISHRGDVYRGLR